MHHQPRMDVVSPPSQVTAINAIYGVEAWNFGSRTIKGRTGNRNRALDKTASQIKAEPAATAVAADNAVAAEAAAAVDLTEAVMALPVKRLPSKKAGGPKKGGAGAKATKKPGTVQICRDCDQVMLIPRLFFYDCSIPDTTVSDAALQVRLLLLLLANSRRLAQTTDVRHPCQCAASTCNTTLVMVRS